MIFTTDKCFGCDAPIERAGGNFYCKTCIAEQEREQGNEREQFDAYHAWVDRQGR